MKYYEIKIHTDEDSLEEVQSRLSSIGYDSYIIEDKRDILDIIEHKDKYEWDYYDKDLLNNEFGNEGTVRLTLYIDCEAEESGLNAVRNVIDSMNAINKTKALFRLADDSDWKDKWKEYFKPARVTDHIVIKPSWEEYSAAEGDKVIEIDPGMAFGTGTHPTTKMCIQFLEEYITPEDAVLDVGCGSGILSIAAALCGAGNVKGVDIDADAVAVAGENLEKNGLCDSVEVFEGDVTEGLGIKADIIAANLMAELIIMIAPDIAAHLTGKSLFISSGIIAEKLEQVKAALEETGFDILDVKEEDGWAAIAARLNPQR